MILLRREAGQTFTRIDVDITSERFTIGRGRDCSLVIHDGSVARRHCVIFQTDQGLFIEDLGSTNGTFVNYQKIQRHPLSFGDRIEPAFHCLYLFQEPPENIAALRQRAAESDAPGAELASLAGCYDPQLLRSIAKNPNTSPKTLEILAGLYPDEVWQNPLMPLLLLSGPLLSDLAIGAVCGLLASRDLSPELLTHFGTHEELRVRLAVAKHSKTPGETIKSLLYQEEGLRFPDFMPALLRHPSFQDEWLMVLYQAASPATKEVLVGFVNRLTEPRRTSLLRVFLQDKDGSVRQGALED